MQILSLAGDIAFRYMKYSTGSIATREVTVCDINEHMLNVGEKRALELGLTEGTLIHF